MDNLVTSYQKMVKKNELLPDKKQALAITQLQEIQDSLTQSDCLEKPWWKKNNPLVKTKPVKGAYLHGKVGGGKSCLMSLFYRTLDCKNKYRVHYHVLMEWIHHKMAEQKHNKNPTKALAKELSAKAKIICIDEFHINNIADAMIMRSLLEYLYEKNILFLFTSNRPPEQLYWRGLQRESFLPAIKLIEDNNLSIDLNNAVDFRKKQTISDNLFAVIRGIPEKEFMENWLLKLSNNAPVSTEPLHISNRIWKVYGKTETHLWIDFQQCCVEFRSRQDYLQIAKQFDVILLSNIRIMDEQSNDQARRFTNLIDTLYDNKIKLIASFEENFEHIYQGEFLKFVFERTISRLYEMQSQKYWIG